ncbi:hypothetical protein E5288_WYG004542 [Bos mutus]|uniref:Uncharacterized protein n=1 Tax=Bos mutus TaxID=72004 RepID=A0A6B0RNI2_9CETA|nr:hypothetical protein [Bos mutus]
MRRARGCPAPGTTRGPGKAATGRTGTRTARGLMCITTCAFWPGVWQDVKRGSRYPLAVSWVPSCCLDSSSSARSPPLNTERSRTRGPIGPGKYGYGKAPYILPLQTDSAHPPQRLRRQRPSSRNSRSQGASGSSHGYHPSAHQPHQHGPLYQSESGPRSGLQASEGSVYQLPLTHDQGFPAASSLFHSPEASSSPGLGAPRAAQSFSQPTRSTAISCIGAYRQYKLCNTNVCPESSRSIWEVQCASYNNKPFMGRFYEWEPFAEENILTTARKYQLGMKTYLIWPSDHEFLALCISVCSNKAASQRYELLFSCSICNSDPYWTQLNAVLRPCVPSDLKYSSLNPLTFSHFLSLSLLRLTVVHCSIGCQEQERG